MTFTTRSMLAFTIVSFASAPAARAGQFNVNAPDSDRASCSSLRVSSDEYQIASAEQAVPAGAGPLHVTAPQNGGIWITGSDAATPSVQACKFTAATGDAAQKALAAIRVRSEGNRITATGPNQERWIVYFIVQAPRGSDVTADAINGPISVRGFEGTLNARAKNGPVGITDSRGMITADTVNGPLSVVGSGGDVHATAQNGPLGVTLNGDEWDGPGLQASTSNGPLSLKLSADYRSGVVVESDGHSPFSCRGCSNARDTREDGTRRLEFGSMPERVHLKTHNGPVSVKRSAAGE
jgi:hypothetical protein